MDAEKTDISSFSYHVFILLVLGLLTSLLSNATLPDFFHFQTSSFPADTTSSDVTYGSLSDVISLPLEPQMPFYTTFSQMLYGSWRPVNRLWCVKLVNFSFSLKHNYPQLSDLSNWTKGVFCLLFFVVFCWASSSLQQILWKELLPGFTIFFGLSPWE